MNYVNKIAQLIIPDSILVIDRDGNPVTEKSDEKPLGNIQDVIVLNNTKKSIIDEAKRKRRFESMMEESEDEDQIEEIKDSNQNFTYRYTPDINIEISTANIEHLDEYTEEWSTEAVVNAKPI